MATVQVGAGIGAGTPMATMCIQADSEADPSFGDHVGLGMGCGSDPTIVWGRGGRWRAAAQISPGRTAQVQWSGGTFHPPIDLTGCGVPRLWSLSFPYHILGGGWRGPRATAYRVVKAYFATPPTSTNRHENFSNLHVAMLVQVSGGFIFVSWW